MFSSSVRFLIHCKGSAFFMMAIHLRHFSGECHTPLQKKSLSFLYKSGTSAHDAFG
jgi:hypothetical protein